MKPLITVFTPTYNRSHTLPRTYESLCAQSNKDFCWLIIDDGSSDDTAQLVSQWQKRENGFDIHYVYKENGGMHTAHNSAYQIIDTELNVCIDSDDKLASDAVQIIHDVWNEVRDKQYAGIIGLDADFSGSIIGSAFLKEYEPITLSSFYENGGTGDKKLVYRTEIMQSILPYPEYAGEKLVPLSYKYILCDQKYSLCPINKVLCNVEYQQDGSTNRIWAQYYQSPTGFSEFRKVRMKYSHSTKRVFTDAVHYVATSIIAGKKKLVADSPKKVITVLCLIPGALFSLYIKRRAGK